MAKLDIEIEENEFSLYDVNLYVNGSFRFAGENFTSEKAAYDHAVGVATQ